LIKNNIGRGGGGLQPLKLKKKKKNKKNFKKNFRFQNNIKKKKKPLLKFQ